MKKSLKTKLIIAAVAVAVVGISAVVLEVSGASDRIISNVGGYIGFDKAKEIALASAGIDAKDAKFTETELDWDDGTMYYCLDFITSDAKYEIEIDADTGAITDFEKDFFGIASPN